MCEHPLPWDYATYSRNGLYVMGRCRRCGDTARQLTRYWLQRQAEYNETAVHAPQRGAYGVHQIYLLSTFIR